MRLTRDEMSVWDDAHPKPAGGPEFERKLLRWLTDDAEKQLSEAAKSTDEFRKIFGGALDVVIGRNLSEVGNVEWDMKEKTDRGSYLEMVGLVRNTTHSEEVPAVFLYPKQWNNQTVIWLDAQGKAGLFAAGGGSRPKPEIEKLLVSGVTVVGVDLLFQGEFLADGKPITQTRSVKNTREAAPYTFGYNPTLFAQRVHDVLTLVKYITGNERKTQALDIVGLGGAGPWAAAALAQCRGEVHRAVIDTGGFRFGKVLDLHDVNFLPAAPCDDLPGLLALAAARLWLAGEGAEAPALAGHLRKSRRSEATRSLQGEPQRT